MKKHTGREPECQSVVLEEEEEEEEDARGGCSLIRWS